jgi:TPR repeat protein
MKSFRQRVRSAAHQGLRWFVRVRLWAAMGFVLGFGVYEACRYYRTGLGGLPHAVRQDVADGWDDLHGSGDLQRDPKELKAKADGGHAFAQFVYALRRTDRLPTEYRITPVDLQVAKAYFQKAAEGDLVRAKAVLASFWLRDLAANPQAPVNRTLLEQYAKEASDRQDPLGRRVWGDILLERGRSTQPGNRELEQKGYRQLLSSAARGTRTALRKVGEFYLEGRHGFTDDAGAPILVQNFARGIACFEQAALSRDFEACCRLAEIHEGNQYVPADVTKAYAWSLVAMQLVPRDVEQSQSPDAAQRKRLQDEAVKRTAVEDRLKALQDRMAPAELAAAQELARSILVRMPTAKEFVESILLKAK